MSPEQMKQELSEVCYEIGCSGLSGKCPGDSCCEILRKIAKQSLKGDNDEA